MQKQLDDYDNQLVGAVRVSDLGRLKQLWEAGKRYFSFSHCYCIVLTIYTFLVWLLVIDLENP